MNYIGRLVDTLSEKVGGWRVDLCIRTLGVALLLYFILKQNHSDILSFLGRAPFEFLLLSIAGFLLTVWGSTLFNLIFASSAAAWHLYTSILGIHPITDFIGEEYLLFLVLPLTVSLFGVLYKCDIGNTAQKGKVHLEARTYVSSGELDRIILLGFRWILMTTLFFAVLSKTNHDFFNSEVSCMALSDDLWDYWMIPEGFSNLVPSAGWFLFLEILIIPLLLFCPLVGIIYTVAFTQFLANIGPTAFNATIIAMSFAFLPDSQRKSLIRAFRKSLAILVVILIIWMPFSHGAYTGDRAWYQFAVYQYLSLVVCVVCGAQILSLIKSQGFKSLVGFDMKMGLRGIRNKWACTGLIGLIFCLLLNGMSPYFGFKYRLSFAMLSNLRVDDNRWNHMFIPEWFHVVRHDGFVRIHHIQYECANEVDLIHRRDRLGNSLYSPDEFRRRLSVYRENDVDCQILLNFAGEDYYFFHSDTDTKLDTFVAEMPLGRLFQAWLFHDSAQGCLH